MGKSVGQVVGTIGGAIVGFYLGGGPAGAVRGAYIGYSLGTMADPPDLPATEGPRLDEKTFQGSEYGVGLPRIYGGSYGLSGNVIYLENGRYKEVAVKQNTGGKGGAPKQEHTSYRYLATFAVALSEAAAGASVRRIWLGSKLVYHADSDDLATQIQSSRFAAGGDGWLNGAGQSEGFSESQLTQGGTGWKFYDGTQTEPDPRMEAILGVDNCPAYTGTAYLMFYDLDLGDYGNNLAGAQVKVEIIKTPPVANVTNLSDSVMSNDGVTFASGYESTWYLTPQKGISWARQLSTNNIYKFESTPFGGERRQQLGATTFTSLPLIPYGITDVSSGVFFSNNAVFGCPITVSYFQLRRGICAAFFLSTGAENIAVCSNVYPSNRVWHVLEESFLPLCITISDDYIFVASRETSSPNNLIFYVYDHELNLIKSWTPSFPWPAPASSGRFFYDSGWVYFTPQIYANPFTVTKFDPINEIIGDGFSMNHTPSITTGTYNRSYNLAVYGNLLCSSQVLTGVNFSFRHKVWKLYDYERSTESLDDVVEELCNLSGISDSSLDLSAISSDEVRGFLPNLPSSARANLAVLATAYFFDLIEDGYTLKAVKRGGSSVRTIMQEELDARPFGSEPGVKISRDKEMPNRLPSRYTITYVDYNREYENNSQTAEFSSNTENQRNETLPIVLTSDEAIRMADKLGRISWIERDRVSFTLSLLHVDLLPSDILYVETSPDIFEYVRIEDKTEKSDQRVEISGKITDANVYASTLVGSDGAEPDQTITFLGDSEFVPLDIPMLLDSMDTYGLVAAVYGHGNYPGGVLMHSLDGGQTYLQLQTYAGPVAVAIANDTLPSHDGFVIDRENTLNVTVRAGEFSGVTESQMLTGINYVAYGDDGRWEIMQFAGSTLEADGTYTLDTFVRGLKGTEQYTGTHAEGDKVVLLDDSDLAFIVMDSADVGISRSYKPVTFGQQLEYIDDVEFTYNAENLKCLPGVHAVGLRDGSNNWDIEWVCRTRYNSSYWTSGVQPDNEDVLAFEVDVMNGASVVRTISSISTDVTYTSAQQTTDFGSVQNSIEVNIYQIGNTGSRGHALNETFSI